MAKKEVKMFGFTKEQVDALKSYLLEKPAKESILFLQMIDRSPQLDVTFDTPEVDHEDKKLAEAPQPDL